MLKRIFKYVNSYDCTGPEEISKNMRIRFEGTLDEVLSQTLASGALPIAFADLDEPDSRGSLFVNPPEEWNSDTYPQIFRIDFEKFVLQLKKAIKQSKE